MDEKSKVYVLTDERGVIMRCEGGYTIDNIDDISKWTLIAEGDGDRFNLCQSNYFDALYTDDGIPRYKLLDGVPVMRMPSEIEADRAAIPAPAPTEQEILRADVDFLLMMMEG